MSQKWDALIASYQALLPRLRQRANEAQSVLDEVKGEIARLRELQAEESAKEAA